MTGMLNPWPMGHMQPFMADNAPTPPHAVQAMALPHRAAPGTCSLLSNSQTVSVSLMLCQ